MLHHNNAYTFGQIIIDRKLILCYEFASEAWVAGKQGRTGTENRPGQFPTTTLPAQPNFHSTNLGKIQKIAGFPHKNYPFYHFNPAGPPGIAQMQAWPVRP